MDNIVVAFDRLEDGILHEFNLNIPSGIFIEIVAKLSFTELLQLNYFFENVYTKTENKDNVLLNSFWIAINQALEYGTHLTVTPFSEDEQFPYDRFSTLLLNYINRGAIINIHLDSANSFWTKRERYTIH